MCELNEDEHRPSNAQHRILNNKDEVNRYDSRFKVFVIRRWTFEVRCWTFIFILPTTYCSEPPMTPRTLFVQQLADGLATPLSSSRRRRNIIHIQLTGYFVIAESLCSHISYHICKLSFRPGPESRPCFLKLQCLSGFSAVSFCIVDGVTFSVAGSSKFLQIKSYGFPWPQPYVLQFPENPFLSATIVSSNVFTGGNNFAMVTYAFSATLLFV